MRGQTFSAEGRGRQGVQGPETSPRSPRRCDRKAEQTQAGCTGWGYVTWTQPQARCPLCHEGDSDLL